jgi:hypothetical protein
VHLVTDMASEEDDNSSSPSIRLIASSMEAVFAIPRSTGTGSPARSPNTAMACLTTAL